MYDSASMLYTYTLGGVRKAAQYNLTQVSFFEMNITQSSYGTTTHGINSALVTAAIDVPVFWS